MRDCGSRTCKPNSVCLVTPHRAKSGRAGDAVRQDDHSSGPRITAGLKRPTRRFGAPSRHALRRRCKLFALMAKCTVRNACSDGESSSLFGLAPCGVCPARSITAAAVRSYRTFSPLPRRRSKPVADRVLMAQSAVHERSCRLTTTTRRYVFCGTFRRINPPLQKTQGWPPSRTLSGTLLCGVRTFLCLATAIVRSSCQRFHYSAHGKPACVSYKVFINQRLGQTPIFAFISRWSFFILLGPAQTHTPQARRQSEVESVRSNRRAPRAPHHGERPSGQCPRRR